MRGAEWRFVGTSLRFDTAGTHKPVVRLRRGLAETEGPITVSVGADRGSPLFSPRLGDEWRFEYVHRGKAMIAVLIPQTSGPQRVGELTLRVTAERMAHGRRWLRLETLERKPDEDAAKAKTGITWAYFHNGQT